MPEKNELLRHYLASIAYHATKALRDAPPNYPEHDPGNGARTPHSLLHHINSVLTYAHSFYQHYDNTRPPQKPWDGELQGLYDIPSKLDHSIQSGKPRGVTEEQLLQGPLSDAMAHVGQLLMLRRLAGSPVPSENFIHADIKPGQLGPNQPDPPPPTTDTQKNIFSVMSSSTP
jgi:hypothetical protein